MPAERAAAQVGQGGLNTLLATESKLLAARQPAMNAVTYSEVQEVENSCPILCHNLFSVYSLENGSGK